MEIWEGAGHFEPKEDLSDSSDDNMGCENAFELGKPALSTDSEEDRYLDSIEKRNDNNTSCIRFRRSLSPEVDDSYWESHFTARALRNLGREVDDLPERAGYWMEEDDEKWGEEQDLNLDDWVDILD